jgi:hypothetical protein
MALNEIDQTLKIQYDALIANANLDALLGRLKNPDGTDSANPLIMNTKQIPELQTNFPRINLYDASAYTFNTFVRSLLGSINCRDKNNSNDYRLARNIAIEVKNSLNREFITDSGTIYYFQTDILPYIQEGDNVINVPVDVRIKKIN